MARHFFFLLLWFLLFFFAIRIMGFSELFSFSLNTVFEKWELWLQGARFDLLVFCFWFMPFFLFKLNQPFLKQYRHRFLIFYARLSLYWMGLILALDLMFMHLYHRRMQWQDFVVTLKWLYLPNLLVVSKIVLMALFLLFIYQRIKIYVSSTDLAGFRYLVFLFCFLILGARGTVSAIHLRRENCQIFNLVGYDEVCLNPIWNYSKPR